LSQIDRFLIKKIKISGERTISRAVLANQIKPRLEGRYFGLFPKNNAFIYGRRGMIDFLKTNILKIEEAEVSLDDLNTLSINITERQARLLWCKNDPKTCYYADGNGLIFDRAPHFSDGVFLRFEGGLPSEESDSYYVGKNIFPAEYIKMLITFRQRAEELLKKNFSDNWKASYYFLGEGSDIDLFFENGIGGKWKIMMSPRTEEGYSFKGNDSSGLLKPETEATWAGFGGDLESAEANLKVILSSEAFRGSADNKTEPLKNLEYIDLRFGKKIFYKFN